MMKKWKRTRENIKLFNMKNGEDLPELYLKSDTILLADTLGKFNKISFKEFDFNPLNCIILPGYTNQCRLKYTDNKLKTVQDKDMILLPYNSNRGGMSSVMGYRLIRSDETKKILYSDANKLYEHSMSQTLPYDENKFEGNVKFEVILNTPDDNDTGYFVEVDLQNSDNIKEKTENFPLLRKET